MSFAERLRSRQNNNLNLLRLLLAAVVALGHGFHILDLPLTSNFLRIPAVGLFFLLSGLLISASIQNKSLMDYARRRIARIYPGAWFAIAISLLLLAPLGLDVPAKEYFKNSELYEALLRNASLIKLKLHHSMVFPDSPMPAAINGSLWSLPFEVMAYLAIVPLFVLGLLRKPFILYLLFLTSYSIVIIDSLALLDLQLPPILLTANLMACYFSLGMAVYATRHKIPMNTLLALLSLLAIVLSTKINLFNQVFLLPFYCYLVIYIGLGIPTITPNFIQKNDISYGIYLLHFPIFQYVTGFELEPFLGLILAALLILVFAIVSWRFIEKPSMRWAKSKSEKSGNKA